MGEVLIEPTEVPTEVDTTDGLVDVSLRSTEVSLRVMFEPHEATELIDELTEAVDEIEATTD
jgi:hypothetical protein